MRLIDSPAVRLAASRYSEAERAQFLDSIRYEGVFDEVGTNMRLLIRQQGLTQRQVAERLGTSETALSRMLRGKNVKNVKFETVVRFAKAVGVDVLAVFDTDLLASSSAPALATTVEPAPSEKPKRTVWVANVGFPRQFANPLVIWDYTAPTTAAVQVA